MAPLRLPSLAGVRSCALLLLLLVAATALSHPVPGAALPLGAKVCRLTDKCSKALLSAPPGKVVGDSCGSEYLLLATCRARKLKACTYKKCTRKAVQVRRGDVTKDGCGKMWRVTDTCKLVAITPKCYWKCFTPPPAANKGKADAKKIPAWKRKAVAKNIPLTCAEKCTPPPAPKKGKAKAK